MKSNLKKQIIKLPKKPGVYLFKNQNNKIIYIGKALSLKSRVKSYFLKTRQTDKTKILVSQVADLDYIILNSEIEALILEAKLIKQHLPKYNVLQKDDKRYLYIAIFKTPFPHLNIVRRVDLDKNIWRWFGPFPSGNSAQQVFRFVRGIFPFCSCSTLPKKNCLYSHINLCPGPENLNSKEHLKNIGKINSFLSGKTTMVIKKLEKEMKAAAKKLKFEEAQKHKNQIFALKNITQTWRSIPDSKRDSVKTLTNLRKLLAKYGTIEPTTLNKIEGYDISNLGKNIIVGSMVTFVSGEKEPGLYRKFKITLINAKKESRKNLEKQNDTEAIKQIIKRRLNHPEWIYPQLILVDGGKGQVSAAFSALAEKNLANQIAVIGLAKKQEEIIIPKISKNKIVEFSKVTRSKRSATLKLLQEIRDESHRFAQNYYKILHKKTTFGNSK
jgi:excinuclease ABC subunit C